MRIPEKDSRLDESTTERDLVNDARDIDTVKQITHNIQKTNVDRN
jgi:hypothetical protein